MENILENLNPSQLEAVTSMEGYIRVIAGAGSGKTRALTHRFAFLVNEVGILPGNILFLIIPTSTICWGLSTRNGDLLSGI